jgi:putative spermidine/putrescine transport system substrate-binding protein
MARGGWVIPKGSKNKEQAMKLFAVMAGAESQAAISALIGSSGTNLDSNNHLSEDVRRLLPLAPENAPKQVWVNEEWWAANGETAEQRWNEWKLSKG